MLKFLIISILIFYLIFKVGSFLLRHLFQSAYQQQQQYHRQYHSGNGSQRESHQRKAPNSNVNIDYVPEKDSGSRRKKGSFDGGEYVDYEEVK